MDRRSFIAAASTAAIAGCVPASAAPEVSNEAEEIRQRVAALIDQLENQPGWQMAAVAWAFAGAANELRDIIGMDQSGSANASEYDGFQARLLEDHERREAMQREWEAA